MKPLPQKQPMGLDWLVWDVKNILNPALTFHMVFSYKVIYSFRFFLPAAICSLNKVQKTLTEI